MATLKQIDFLHPILFLFKHITLWPPEKANILHKYYKYYKLFVLIFLVVIYDFLFTISFLSAPNDIQLLITETIFFFTEIPIACKFITILVKRKKVVLLLNMLESDIFQPESVAGIKILSQAKKFISWYFRALAVTSVVSWSMLVLQYAVPHIFFSSPLILPVSRFYFLSDEVINKYIYYMFFYQIGGMYIHMMTNVTVDSFIVAIMRLAEAQLDILDSKLMSIKINVSKLSLTEKEQASKLSELNQCIIHYTKIETYCRLFEDIFSETIFVTFGIAACIICITFVCFTLEMTNIQTIFMVTYLSAMISQIAGPSWLGTQIVRKSQNLSFAAYNSDWLFLNKAFKCNLIVFMQRSLRPIRIFGGKMFSVSLESFTSIMKTAYSFFAVLRKMQSGEPK